MFERVDYVMIVVSNMSRSVEFYRDKLGLPLKFESPEWTEFQTGSTTLALHGGGTAKSQPPSAEAGKEAGSCSIGFNVSDLDKAYQELSSRGVHFVMPPAARQDEGIKLAVAIDPDGLAVSFAENIRK
jgi:lactoylglutathione lyase